MHSLTSLCIIHILFFLDQSRDQKVVASLAFQARLFTNLADCFVRHHPSDCGHASTISPSMASILHSLQGSTSTSRSLSPSPSDSASQLSERTDGINNNTSTTEGAVDLEAIEQQKENIQPLSSGRSAKALHNLFTSDRKVLQDELEKGHERFKSEIETVEEEGSDDPLDVYHRCV